MIKIVKCVVVGDGTVGKTSLIITYQTNSFPSDYVPAVFDNYSCSIVPKNRIIPQIGDTVDLEEYKQHRIDSYQLTDVFIICFSLDSISSMDRVENFWVPEIKSNCPSVPFILVGTKSDLRGKNTTNEDNSKNSDIISSKQGEKLKKRIGAKCYIECSALNSINVREVFDEAMKYGIKYQKKKSSK